MIPYWTRSAIAVTVAFVASAFNIDTKHPILASRPPTNDENSLFGYSLVINGSSLYVGAPGHEAGRVYRCDFDGVSVERQVLGLKSKAS